MFEDHRAIQQLNEYSTILHGFDRIGDLDQFAGGDFRVCVWAGVANFIRHRPLIWRWYGLRSSVP
jgi:hypothetical protein